ncbi:MAG: alkaline phosphatase [Rikenellaceae bacterium]
MKSLQRFFAIAVVVFACLSCGSGSSNSSNGSGDGAVKSPAKYIFYFIGDGMAATQVRLAEAALTAPEFRENFAQQIGIESTPEQLFLKSVSTTGLATSNASDRFITDSAAAGTALATGSKTDVGVISLAPDGSTLVTMAELAKQKGMKVGVVTSVSLDHATPASFYAHSKSRSLYPHISDQLITSGFDYFGGGFVKIDSRARSEKSDKAAAYAAYRSNAEEAGFKLVTTKAEFDQVGKGETQPVIATIDLLAGDLYSGDGFALPYTIDLGKQTSDDNKITLTQFTQKGIDLLENKDGFFMMVEGGKIDWACHANDAATCAYEVVAFDQAIGVAMAFAAKHPKETLIVVTGDHDCGGLSIGFSGTGYESAFDILAGSRTSYTRFAESAKKMIESGDSFEKLLSFACQEFGFTNNTTGDGAKKIVQSRELSDFEVKMLRDAYKHSGSKDADQLSENKNLYGYYDPFTTTCTNILNNKSGLEFASNSHTAVPVMVFAHGANAEIFSGYYDNTDIAKKIIKAGAL